MKLRETLEKNTHPSLKTILEIRKALSNEPGFPKQYCVLGSNIVSKTLNKIENRKYCEKVTEVCGSINNHPHVFNWDPKYSLYIDITADQITGFSGIYIGEEPPIPRNHEIEEFYENYPHQFDKNFVRKKVSIILDKLTVSAG